MKWHAARQSDVKVSVGALSFLFICVFTRYNHYLLKNKVIGNLREFISRKHMFFEMRVAPEIFSPKFCRRQDIGGRIFYTHRSITLCNSLTHSSLKPIFEILLETLIAPIFIS